MNEPMIKVYEYLDSIVIKKKKTYYQFMKKTIKINTLFSLPTDIPLISAHEIKEIFGFLKINGFKFLLYVSENDLLGEIRKKQIFRVKKFGFIVVNSKRIDQNSMYLFKLVFEELNNRNCFYYSKEYKMTNTFALQNSEIINEKFYWNKFLSYDLPKELVKTVFIRGYVGNIQNKYWIISRLSCKRVGTRYNSRGVDDNGFTSNFIQTEQIVMKGDLTYSFIILRGSVPIKWNQKVLNYFKYNPDIFISPTKSLKHLRRLVEQYKQVYCVNLLNNKLPELALSEEFRKLVKGQKKIKYTEFDFHKECSKLRYFNIQDMLIDKILINDIKSFKFNTFNNNKIISKQNGVFRINCKDSLDRTNVVCSVISRNILRLFCNEMEFDENMFKLIWFDNGNNLSYLYSGSESQKSDYVKYGKRTILGIFNDLRLSIIRYVKNSFFDHLKQMSVDMILGQNVEDEILNYDHIKKMNKKEIAIITFFIVLVLWRNNVQKEK